jgi:hypothetical protein
MRTNRAILLMTLMTAPASAQTVTESGVSFPVAMTVADGSRQLLAGTGLRTRTVLGVKVYAFGLYLDSAGARAALASFAGRSAEDLAREQSVYDALLRMGFPMTMRLVMVRNVTGEQMSEAFDGALRPRVQQAAGRGMAGGEAALDQFRGYFSVERLTQGAELVFTCTADGTLHSRVSGENKQPISSRALCWALFDVYLGRNPISPPGRRTVIARVPGLLGG